MASWMKAASVAALAGLVIGLGPNAQAANGWQDVAWRDMQRFAPAGSMVLGRYYTLTQVQKTCAWLSAGIPAADILDDFLLVASQSATTQKQKREMGLYGLVVITVAGKRLCPAYLPDVWAAINR